MRKYIDIINEAVKPTQTFDPRTQTKDAAVGDFDLLRSLEPEQSVATTGKRANTAVLPGTRAKKSRRRLHPVDLGPEGNAKANSHLASLHSNLAGQEDIISDDEARRNAGVGDDAEIDVPGAPDLLQIGHEKPTTDQLPAVIRQEVEQTGGRINPEWRTIRELPRYIQQPIRVLGRALFRQFTATPIEDIQMIGTIGGLNSDREVAGMADWIRRHGVRDDLAAIDFSQIMPGYQADTSLWNTEEFTFLLVKDFGGLYIYGWGGGRGSRVDAPPARKQLK